VPFSSSNAFVFRGGGAPLLHRIVGVAVGGEGRTRSPGMKKMMMIFTKIKEVSYIIIN
jgi:hypothetical protein